MAQAREPMIGVPGQEEMLLDVNAVLAGLPSVTIRQQRNLGELVTAAVGVDMEFNNKYVIYDPAGVPVFYARENSSWIERNCFPPDCAPWRMTIFQLGSHAQIINQGGGRISLSSTQMAPFLYLERPCSFTCCCFNRPEVFITDMQVNTPLGSVRDPCACCDLTYTLKDDAGAEVLAARGKCCQCGLCCPCVCDGCPGKEVLFPISDADSGAVVGHCKKIWEWGDACPWCFKEWDNYQVNFDAVTNPQWKTMLIAMGLFIDVRHFNPRNKN